MGPKNPSEAHNGAGLVFLDMNRLRALAWVQAVGYKLKMSDFAQCDVARLGREPAFEAVFFTAVKTTIICCRPNCPVGAPFSRNVSFYSTAAAAEHACYRPCLRCRPWTAPNRAAWIGTRTTVTRALRLIDEGALYGTDTIAALAERLGTGQGHLPWLFQRHLGAAPSQVVKTVRVQRARRLVDTVQLPGTKIARMASLLSARWCYTAFDALYRRLPLSL
jgi:AraC family transcriptional regulator of adaptative response/methylated-DNA-[protein]-cysteine methyltransferase